MLKFKGLVRIFLCSLCSLWQNCPVHSAKSVKWKTKRTLLPQENTEAAKKKKRSYFCALGGLFRPFFDFIPSLAVLLFFGALFWAKAQDPFSRKWFTLRTADHGSVKCVAVLPKSIRPCPVVVYAHGSGGSLMSDGNNLRQMVELGLAVVSLEYDQTNEAAFAGQFEAVLRYVAGQKWADTNAVAWVGFSL
jgi:hypothetical protein